MADTHLDWLLNAKAGMHDVEKKEDFISLRPRTALPRHEALETFQQVADYAIKYNHSGYTVLKTHVSSDQGDGLYDLILIKELTRS